METSGSTWLTFVLLALAICAVWLKPVCLGERITLPPWALLFAAALLAGLLAGVIHLPAIVVLGLFCAATYRARGAQPRSIASFFFGTVTALLALALALHRVPGFSNPVIISAVALSADAAPLTQYANFDKGAVGLVLLAFLCRRTHSGTEIRKRLRQTVPFALATIATVMAVAMSIGYIKPDLKFTQTSVLFLASNLFFTVLAEEAFFRGFLQDRLAVSLARWRFGRSMALLASALLFGLAHAAGGTTYMLLAALAGLGYAAAYTAVQRIEAPLMVHFALNAVHCVAFTYPHLT